MPLFEFQALLKGMDWHYDRSDDVAAFRIGREQRKLVDSIATQSEAHWALMREWVVYQLMGGPKPTEIVQ